MICIHLQREREQDLISRSLFLWLLIMKNFILLALTSLFLVGCATHTPAPKPSGQLFKINERSLVQPQIQSIQLEASND